MTNIISDTSQRKAARVAGFLYLLLAVCSAFSMMYVESIFAPGDAEATVSKILASQQLFRLAFVGSLVGQVFFLFLAMPYTSSLNQWTRTRLG